MKICLECKSKLKVSEILKSQFGKDMNNLNLLKTINI